MQGDFRIGGWLIQPQLHTIEGNGKATRVEPKAMQVLVYLAEHADQVVSKEKVISAVWADTFVTDDVLTRCISELRRAFDDNAKNPQIIETIPKSGYRIVATVQEAEATPAEARARRWPVALAVAAGLIGLAALALVLNIGGVRERIFRSAPRAQIRSLAVLPLENLSKDPEQEYFADGMTEAITAELAQISALKVISRNSATSVMKDKGAQTPMAEIAKKLGVDAVIEGSVQREGNQVRITVQLIEGATDKHLWAHTYQREIQSILALQSEVASAIAVEIRVKLTPQEQSRLASTRPVNPKAYEAYVMGVFLIEKETRDGITKGIEYFRQSIDIDSTYAPAYAALADGYARAAAHGVQPATQAFPTAREAVSKALELDDALAEAHTMLGVIKFRFDWDWAGAERELKRALELGPNNSRAHIGYSNFLNVAGRTDEAIQEALRSVELDPLTAERHINLAWKLYCAGRYDEAITQLGQAVELAPDSASAYSQLARNYAAKGTYPRAITLCEKALALPLDHEVLGDCGLVYVLAGRRRQAIELLRRLLTQKYVSSYQVAFLQDALGDRSDALRRLVQASEERAPELTRLKIDIFSTELRADPRFQDLVRRMNFPP